MYACINVMCVHMLKPMRCTYMPYNVVKHSCEGKL